VRCTAAHTFFARRADDMGSRLRVGAARTAENVSVETFLAPRRIAQNRAGNQRE
jgi:hypothetical protein